jgi:hypothetical protein
MSDNKITFGKPKTPGQQPAYVPEQAPENIDNVRVYDFGKKYSVIDFKFQELKQGAVYTAGFEVTQGQGSFIFKTTFYNVYGQEVSTTSVEVPEGTPIESVELDYENKELVIHTVGGEDIIADFSEMIDKIETLELEVEDLKYEVAVGIGEEEPDNARTWFETAVGVEEHALESYTEFTVSYNDGQEINSSNVLEASLEQELGSSVEINPTLASINLNNNEQVAGFSDNEAAMTFQENEQSIGFSENEAPTFISNEQNQENLIGLSDTETVESTENNIELNPGFSNNEIK